MPSKGIYFFHIPKTAGTSVYHFLDKAYDKDQICPWGLWDDLVTASNVELANWNIFRGHFLSHLEPFLNRSLLSFTLLRDPVARTMSHYCHVRRSPEHPSHRHAVSMTLAEFCVHPYTRHMVENYQASYLAKSAQDVRNLVTELPPDYAERFELQERLQYPDEFENPDDLLQRAAARLSQFRFVGITELFTESLLEYQRIFECPETLIEERANSNPEGTFVNSLDPSTLHLIRELTSIDQTLYDSQRAKSGQEI